MKMMDKYTLGRGVVAVFRGNETKKGAVVGFFSKHNRAEPSRQVFPNPDQRRKVSGSNRDPLCDGPAECSAPYAGTNMHEHVSSL